MKVHMADGNVSESLSESITMHFPEALQKYSVVLEGTLGWN